MGAVKVAGGVVAAVLGATGALHAVWAVTPWPLAFDGPAMLRGLARAEALAVVPPGGAAAGETVELLEVP